MSAIRRRAFVGTLAGACAGAAALPGCASIGTYRPTTAPGAGGLAIPVAEFERLAAGRGAIRVESPTLPEAVILLAVDGGYRAIGSTCTHQQCAVRPAKTYLRCACHGSTFDLSGAVLRGPATASLTVYAATHDGITIRLAIRGAA